MMKPPVLFALAFTLIFNLPVVSNSTPEQPKNNTLDSATPVFAKVLDVKLGEDAECKLERRIGKGHETIGGHCNSGREWSFHNGLQLRADGFDLNHDGYILDTLIFSKWRGQLGDTKELAKFGLGVWG